jgi:hypothetical protein
MMQMMALRLFRAVASCACIFLHHDALEDPEALGSIAQKKSVTEAHLPGEHGSELRMFF